MARKKQTDETDGAVAVADAERVETAAKLPAAPAAPADEMRGPGGGARPIVNDEASAAPAGPVAPSTIGAPPFLGDRSGGDRPSPDGGGGGYQRLSSQRGQPTRSADGDPRRKMSELLNRETDNLLVLDSPFASRIGPAFVEAFWVLCEAHHKGDRQQLKACLAGPDPLGTLPNLATRIVLGLFEEETKCWRGDSPAHANPRADLVTTLRTRFLEAPQVADGGPDLTWCLKRVIYRVVFVDKHTHSVVLRCGLFADIADFDAVLAALREADDYDLLAACQKATKRYKTVKKTWASREEQNRADDAERLADLEKQFAPRLALLAKLGVTLEEFTSIAEFARDLTTHPHTVVWREAMVHLQRLRKAAASAPAG